MIANARMYSVSPAVAGLWRELLATVIVRSGLAISLIEHAEPTSIDVLWRRRDKAAVFMCGLPLARSDPQEILIAAPVPSPVEFCAKPQYWSEFVVREAGPYRRIDQISAGRMAFTVPDSQSGCLAALKYFMTSGSAFPRFQEVIAPQITPQRAVSAVIEGAADIAPIDSYALALLRRYRPDLTSQLRVIARTDPTPIPAFVASPGALLPGELAALRSAFLEAHVESPTRELLARLSLLRFVLPAPASYSVLRDDFEVVTRYWRAHQLAAVIDPAFQW